MSPVADARAWGWFRHLRDGGTTPWAAWTEPGEPAGAVVPSAQTLELLRRLNLAGRPDPALVDRVLQTSPPGRGQPDLELVGAGRDSAFGPRPVDPVDLPARELLRVAALLIAEDLVAAGVPPRQRPGWTRPWRTRYRLLGDSQLADPVREHLLARGRPPGGRHARIVVLAAPLDQMLAHAYTRRCLDQGPPGWPSWVARLADQDELPLAADPLRQARRWRGQARAEEIEVVLDRSLLPRRVGVRRLPDPPELPAVATDLARRVAGLLGLFVSSEERVALLRRRLRPRLADVSGPLLALPERHLDWARDRAERLAEGLRRDGYAVHGELDDLRPSHRSGVVAPDADATLDLALRLVLEGVGGRR